VGLGQIVSSLNNLSPLVVARDTASFWSPRVIAPNSLVERVRPETAAASYSYKWCQGGCGGSLRLSLVSISGQLCVGASFIAFSVMPASCTSCHSEKVE
jgi:hypothetical protein